METGTETISEVRMIDTVAIDMVVIELVVIDNLAIDKAVIDRAVIDRVRDTTTEIMSECRILIT